MSGTSTNHPSMRYALLFTFAFFSSLAALGQKSTITGRVSDAISNESLPIAAVKVEGANLGSTTDFDGRYTIEDLEPGLYNLQISLLGYAPRTIYEVEVTALRPAIVDVQLEASTTRLEEVVIDAQSRFPRRIYAPVVNKNNFIIN